MGMSGNWLEGSCPPVLRQASSACPPCKPDHCQIVWLFLWELAFVMEFVCLEDSAVTEYVGGNGVLRRAWQTFPSGRVICVVLSVAGSNLLRSGHCLIVAHPFWRVSRASVLLFVDLRFYFFEAGLFVFQKHRTARL
jgi:hypothetical protein